MVCSVLVATTLQACVFVGSPKPGGDAGGGADEPFHALKIDHAQRTWRSVAILREHRANQAELASRAKASSDGDESDSVRQARETGRCTGCSFGDADVITGVQTAFVDYSDSDFTGTTFSNVSFPYGVSFDNATLTNVSFETVDFASASFDKTALTDVTFSTTTGNWVNFDCPVFSSTTALESDFSILNVTWTGSNACPQTFTDGSIVGFGFVPFEQWGGLNMSNTEIFVSHSNQCFNVDRRTSNANLSNTIFLGETPFLQNVEFFDSDLSSTRFARANLEGTAFTGTTSIANADFEDALLDGASFSGNMGGAVFDNSSMAGAEFVGADLTNPSAASFNNVYAPGANFGSVTADGVSFQGSYLFEGSASAPVACPGGQRPTPETQSANSVLSFAASDQIVPSLGGVDANGGNLGLDLARRHADRVRRVVAFGANHTPPPDGADPEPVKEFREAKADGAMFWPLRHMYEGRSPTPERWPEPVRAGAHHGILAAALVARSADHHPGAHAPRQP